jgi:hypothetical protein
MLIETKVRFTRKEANDKEVTEYVPALLNTDQVKTVLPSGMDGVLLVMMTDSTNHLVKDGLETFTGGAK